MRSLWSIGVLAVASLVVPASARAEALFASPPHFLALRDREEIVFFINEPVVGALASQTPSGTVEVIVPHAVVDPTVGGTTFHGDDRADAAATRVVLAPAARGNAAIQITASRPPVGVHAYSEKDPPRLVIDLLAAPQPTPTPARKALARPAPAPPRLAAAAPQLPRPDAPSPRPDAPPTRNQAPAFRPGAHAAGHDANTPAVLAALAVDASAHADLDDPEPDAAASPAAPAASGASTGADATTFAGTTTATAAADAPPQAFACAWRRVGAVAYCAPDPDAPPYAARADLTAMARALRAADPVSLPPAVTDDEPGTLYLAADRELVARAASGRLLPAIDVYRRALRRAPRFFDAARARLNVALAYRALGFATELDSVAQEAAQDPTRPIIDAAIGDLARERDATERARDAYRRAAAGGGLAACLATRGQAALVLATEPPASAAAQLARLPQLCPPEILADPETIRIQARQQLADNQPQRALAMLQALRGTPDGAANGAALADLAGAAAAVGDDATARRSYADLASGRFGGRLAMRATLALAQLDTASGNIAAGFRRLDTLGAGRGSEDRRRIAIDAVVRALRRGADAEAVAIVAEQGLSPTFLAGDDQIALAHAYRAVGLASEADALLRALAERVGAAAPDALWRERGEAALATNPAQALAIADEWLRRRGTAAPTTATALRARALAAVGQGSAATKAVDDAVALDPSGARALRLDVARRLRTADPVAALRLARAALDGDQPPPLAPADVAGALRVVAESAEATGEAPAALAAYRELVDRYADQPATDGVAYRLARLAAGDGAGAARAGYADVARSHDALERRVATAAEAYEAIVKPFENRREAP